MTLSPTQGLSDRVGISKNSGTTDGSGLSLAGGSAPVSPPVNTVAPVLSGSFFVGKTLACSTGTWTGSGISYTYQWRNAGVDMGGATASTYVVQSGDDGDVLDCVVTATNGGGAVSEASSNSFIGVQTVLLLDASDTSSITESGGLASQINDLSGSGYNLTQGTGANQPATGSRTVNGLNTLDFDGTNDTMFTPSAISISQQDIIITIFLADNDGSGGDRYVHDGTPSSSGRQALILNGTYGIFAGTGPITGGTVATGSALIAMSRFNGGSSNLRVGGTSIVSGNAGTGNLTRFCIGSRNAGLGSFFEGAFCELAIISGASSTAILNQIGAYANSKWGAAYTAF